MATKLAINGFGRIGRNVLRALMEQDNNDLQVIAINDLAPVGTNAHLFESVCQPNAIPLHWTGVMSISCSNAPASLLPMPLRPSIWKTGPSGY